MRASAVINPTLKETPADAEVQSHVLLLRAGFIRRVASGLYTWLPFGLRVLRKVEAIVREELNRSGAQELLMPVVQPGELWRESGRWDVMGPEMMRMKDRHDRDYALSPTHEEVITDLVRRVVDSYKQLPCNLYQIQTKFRDEIRPRFGLMRAREFTMKDGYSFHLDEASFEATYQDMYDCYSRILTRIGLKFRAVEADPGAMGDGESHEFQVLAASGEDVIAFSPNSDYAANIERAEALAVDSRREDPLPLAKVHTPDRKTIAAVAEYLGLEPSKCLKTLIVRGQSSLVALVLRGDHELNETKASRLDGIIRPLEFADDDEIEARLNVSTGSIGPIGLEIPIFVDRSAATVTNFACGANENDYHYSGANWNRDANAAEVVDIRNVVEGDQACDGSGELELTRGIEAGHIFKLGTKYTRSMNFTIQNAKGEEINPIMGCYGMGITRTVAAIVEQCHDDNGIVWPESVAPFAVHIIALNYAKSEDVRSAADDIYNNLSDVGIEVLLDDRDDRPGVKFAEADLIGIPMRITVGERNLKNGQVEFKRRADEETELVPLDEVLSRLNP
ncbi:MAG: proline--tRNA ligase [Gammaproteobacteria bacterium]|nr:proline--tRNA ligase [Gammaproteobacteria bacterium]